MSKVEVHPDSDSLATSVAGELLHRLAALQSTGKTPHVGLTGGTIADAIHRAVARLAESPGAPDVDWQRVVFWWGDERYVAADSPDRNARQARAALLDQVGVDPANVHEMPAAGFGPLQEAAASYGEEMRHDGSGEFDILMLGIGPDGHIASLFPGFPQLDVVDRVTVPVTGSPKPPSERISLTFSALNRSRVVWFLVSGAEKAPAVAKALSPGTDLHEIPAAGVTGSEETTWFLDHDSASRL